MAKVTSAGAYLMVPVVYTRGEVALVEARVPVTLWTNGSTTLPACRRCNASRSPEYSSEEDEVVEEEDEEEEVVGVP